MLFQESHAQDIELRHLENIDMSDERNKNDHHIVKGNPSKITYTNYEYDKQAKAFKETLEVFLNMYRNSTFNIDSLGRIKDRSLSIYDDRSGIDHYHYREKSSQQKELFIERYWWKDIDNIQTDLEFRFRMKEVYHDNLVIKRFDYERENEFVYDDKNNLIEIILNIYKNPHQYNEEGIILNLTDNTIIESNTLFSYTYDAYNKRIEKKEINTEHITYITRYIYDKDDRLIKEIKLDYSDHVLSHINPIIYKYNAEGDIIELNEYFKTTLHQTPSGTEEEYIQEYLAFITDNPTYYKEHKTYSYVYDTKGNWISKTFYKKEWDTGYDPIYKLTRKIEYK